MKTTNAFLLMWNQYGLEGAAPITQFERIDQDNIVRILKGEKAEPNPLNGMLRAWILRARFNPQRNYEVWAIDVEDPNVNEQDWYDWFDENPQQFADLVRSKGVCQYRSIGAPDEIKIR